MRNFSIFVVVLGLGVGSVQAQELTAIYSKKGQTRKVSSEIVNASSDTIGSILSGVERVVKVGTVKTGPHTGYALNLVQYVDGGAMNPVRAYVTLHAGEFDAKTFDLGVMSAKSASLKKIRSTPYRSPGDGPNVYVYQSARTDMNDETGQTSVKKICLKLDLGKPDEDGVLPNSIQVDELKCK